MDPDVAGFVTGAERHPQEGLLVDAHLHLPRLLVGGAQVEAEFEVSVPRLGEVEHEPCFPTA